MKASLLVLALALLVAGRTTEERELALKAIRMKTTRQRASAALSIPQPTVDRVSLCSQGDLRWARHRAQGNCHKQGSLLSKDERGYHGTGDRELKAQGRVSMHVHQYSYSSKQLPTCVGSWKYSTSYTVARDEEALAWPWSLEACGVTVSRAWACQLSCHCRRVAPVCCQLVRGVPLLYGAATCMLVPVPVWYTPVW